MKWKCILWTGETHYLAVGYLNMVIMDEGRMLPNGKHIARGNGKWRKDNGLGLPSDLRVVL